MTDKVRIYSDVTGLWWRPDGKGYTYIRAEAGLYTRADAKTKITDDPRRKERLIDEDDPFDPRTESRKETELLALRAQLAAPPTVDRDALRDAIADALGDAYDCTRVWSAWGYGTMSQDDFRPVADDEDRLMEIVDAVVVALAARQPYGVGVTQGQAMAEAFKDLAQRQTALGAEASAAITAQDLWDMHDTGEKETP